MPTRRYRSCPALELSRKAIRNFIPSGKQKISLERHRIFTDVAVAKPPDTEASMKILKRHRNPCAPDDRHNRRIGAEPATGFDKERLMAPITSMCSVMAIINRCLS